MPDLDKLHAAVIAGDWKAAAAVTHAAIAEGIAPLTIVTGYLVPAMGEVGRLFECEEYFVPEMLLSARAMKASMEIVRPLLAAAGDEPVGRVVIGTVKGDLHDIGKNLVASMLEGGGFEVIDLGADVAPERFIEAAAARNAHLVALSALLTVTMPSMKTTIDAFQASGLRDKVKIMVGGAPVTQQYADAIGADGYSDSAGAAVALARKLVADAFQTDRLRSAVPRNVPRLRALTASGGAGEFLPKGLHDLGGKPMAAKIQEVVDRTPEGMYDAILLGYGLCGNGLDGLTARHTPLVLPRAHDCIALLMGSGARHQEYFESNPGTYYRSTGWLERGKGLQQLTRRTLGFDESLEALIGKYGEDNGRYLYEEMTRYRAQYRKLTFIETGLEANGKFVDEAAAEAKEKGWSFERLTGDLAWIVRLAEGEWAEAEFVIAAPGQRIAASYDTTVVKVQP